MNFTSSDNHKKVHTSLKKPMLLQNKLILVNKEYAKYTKKT